MRKALLHSLAWTLCTGGAVTLSWWGVHSVMTEPAYVPPRALPLLTASPSPAAAAPLPSRTSPPVSAAASPASRAVSPSASPAVSAAAGRAAAPDAAGATVAATVRPPTAAPAGGRVEGYDTAGGRAVFDLGTTSATLVSATPKAGWSMQVWKTESWIRVEFTSGPDHVSVFCTWHDGPPSVETGTY
ncbi:hypothetical protein [Streptomyces sp. NBC_00102]|uniref:hypothetical protein n=1 Tax=Streptomyces sp. NBC_00102 TaxID=2975652 RepID=UPI0022510915|nr:hypothetical protein [Streptomyces sp. NBC_00102]MCX5402315.1 hypothetical protein [Streptomyces sp. NBC_00102]